MQPPQNFNRKLEETLGLASSGCHSNGFSLVRDIVEKSGLSYNDVAPWDPKSTVGTSLLIPTRIYCKPFLAAHKQGLIKAASHITGGGLQENVPRMLPSNLSAHIDALTWQVPPVFKWLAHSGNVASVELAKTFNMGIGMVLVVSAQNRDRIMERMYMRLEGLSRVTKTPHNVSLQVLKHGQPKKYIVTKDIRSIVI
jgi:homoserine kinase